MKNLLIVLLTLASTFLTAQNAITWTGGTPGKETKWTEAKNWRGHNVPDKFSFVIIKACNSEHYAQPIIDTEVEVASVEIHSGATLTISETGDLVINGENTFSKGLSNYGGEFINEGQITLKNIDGDSQKDGFAKMDLKAKVDNNPKQMLVTNHVKSKTD